MNADRTAFPRPAAPAALPSAPLPVASIVTGLASANFDTGAMSDPAGAIGAGPAAATLMYWLTVLSSAADWELGRRIGM